MSCEDVCISHSFDDFDNDGEYDRDFTAAEKDLICIECNRPIVAGSRYELATVISYYDDDKVGEEESEEKILEEWATCLDCSSIGDGFSCDGIRAHGSLWEDIRECVFPELTTHCLEKAGSASARAFLLEKWLEWKGLSQRAGTH